MASRFRRTAGLVALTAVMSLAQSARADEARTCIEAAEAFQPLRAASKLRAAREKLLVCGRSQCPRMVQADCTAWAADLERTMPSLVLVARDAKGRDMPGVRVRIDGEPVADDQMGKPVAVDPGRHVVRFEAEGTEPSEVVVVALAGEKNRVVSAELTPAPAPPAAEPAKPEPRTTASAPLPPMVFVLGATAAVGLASGAYFGLSAKNDLDDLRDRCAPRCPGDDLDAARTKALVADVSFAVAGAAALVAVWLVLNRSGPPRAATARAIGLTF